MMTKKDFIALADAIRDHNAACEEHGVTVFGSGHLDTLASFCRSENPRFDRGRWLDYISGKYGPSGGRIRKPKGGDQCTRT